MLIALGILIVVSSLPNTAYGRGPNISPEYALAKAGSTHRFSCVVTQDEPVYWSVRYFGSQITKDIYIGEELLLDEFGTSGRFSVQFNKTLNTYDLIIDNTRKTDGGAYTCTDERGLGKKAFAELIVWDAVMCNVENPSDDFMGENVFNLKKDVIISTCSLNYTGNNRPRLSWFLNGSKLQNVYSVQKSGAVFSRLNLTAKSEHNGANITCEAVIEDLTSSATKSPSVLLWTSPALHVTYAVLRNDTIKECPGLRQILDCCPPCSYNLETYDNGTAYCLMKFSLKCHTKSLVYSVPIPILHSETTSYSTNAMAGIMLGVGAACLVIGIIIAIVFALLYRSGASRNGKKNKSGSGEKQPLNESNGVQDQNSASSEALKMSNSNQPQSVMKTESNGAQNSAKSECAEATEVSNV